MITIKDIAEKTGFSYKTVSRALNGEKGVSEKSALLIKNTADEMGYVANPFAGGLKTGKTGLIGILTGRLGVGIKTDKLYAIQKSLEATGKRSILSCSDLTEASLKEALPSLLSLSEALVVLQPPDNEDLFRLLKGIEKPVLLVDGYSEGLPSLTIDREKGVLEALSLLHNRYDHFLYLNSMPGKTQDGRYKGFIRFTGGLSSEKSWEITPCVGDSFNNGYEGGKLIAPTLNREKRSLILCTNDKMAFGLMKAFYESGIDVPAQAGIIGFDGDRYGPFGYKSLATVKQPVDELGQMTVEILENLLRGTALRKEFPLTTQFVQGDSV